MCTFDMLPLAAIINNGFLCLHGGLSPDMVLKNDIEKFNRRIEPPGVGIFCDILWSDPTIHEDGGLEGTNEAFAFNQVRNCSFFFGLDACNRYLKKNNLITLIRAHEAQPDGYKCHHWGNEGFPQVITIFSAPNYCGGYNNLAAFINFEVNQSN